MPPIAPRRRRRGPARSEAGAVIFEFFLVLPLLMSLVLGLFTGGLAYSKKISIVEAAREGARYGASLPMGTGGSAVSTWETAVKTRVVDASNGAIVAGDVCVKWVLPTGATDCNLSDPTGASNEPTVHLVKVSVTKSVSLEFFFSKRDIVLTGRLVARFERDTG